ncbi:PPOX class F420-dependent oxidoreductase [Streptomyces candidus]|uniref:Pyridoxamine 5'-phosphate oxidase family protein n=1 Tax=Streptomyces candidus TaxID=67283 RepID=A0A7X0HLR5_9ACTN|nr:PPOX class F420-dependent oxidoreductase [Streptomyces candidus]MBB6438473.1 pyridoxamine 5'-phosphate oxidase family protein [Streptomyces candidus]GHH45760.1 PPOX class F420-dependent oxidoreductase [Streptomyces candidus]
MNSLCTAAERAYLLGRGLGRLATAAPDGTLALRPVGFRLNEGGTVDIGGPDNAKSRKYRNAEAHPQVAFVVDDMTPQDEPAAAPGWGRGVKIRGRAELIMVEVPSVAPDCFSNDVVRIHPERIIRWHLEGRGGHARDV